MNITTHNWSQEKTDIKKLSCIIKYAAAIWSVKWIRSIFSPVATFWLACTKLSIAEQKLLVSNNISLLFSCQVRGKITCRDSWRDLHKVDEMEWLVATSWHGWRNGVDLNDSGRFPYPLLSEISQGQVKPCGSTCRIQCLASMHDCKAIIWASRGLRRLPPPLLRRRWTKWWAGPSDMSTQQVWIMLDKTIFHRPDVVVFFVWLCLQLWYMKEKHLVCFFSIVCF